MILCTGFQPIRTLIRGRRDLWDIQRLEEARAGVKNSRMWSIKLVRRANQKIALEFLHINWAVRSVMHGINEAKGALSVGDLCGLAHGRNGTQGIGGGANSYQPRFPIDRALEIAL